MFLLHFISQLNVCCRHFWGHWGNPKEINWSKLSIFFFFCYCLYLLLCVESKVPNFWYKKLYFGHISKFKQIFWTFDNSIFHKLYLRCIAMGWARSATATAACRCLRKKTFSGASIEHRFHILPCIYNYLDNKCVK